MQTSDNMSTHIVVSFSIQSDEIGRIKRIKTKVKKMQRCDSLSVEGSSSLMLTLKVY